MIFLIVYLFLSAALTGWAAFKMHDSFDLDGFVLLVCVFVAWPIILPVEFVDWWRDRQWQREFDRKYDRPKDGDV